MKTKKYIYSKITFFLGLILITTIACERALSEDALDATFSTNPDVYIDGFSSGLDYQPFGNSFQEAFSVDTETKYLGTSSMRFDIPKFGVGYGGANFPVSTPRDLSEYDALTFWAKGSIAADINKIGFGINGDNKNKYRVTRSNLQINTQWRKYIIPLPDASKLTAVKGVFWYAEGAENSSDEGGYTFWIDEMKYEKLGTIGQPRPTILNGNQEVVTSVNGAVANINNFTQTFNLGSGDDVTLNITPNYFDFVSTDINVVKNTVPVFNNDNWLAAASIIGAGTTEITASLNGTMASGSLTVNSIGDFESAPTPISLQDNVISIFSDAYTNVPLDFLISNYEPYQITTGSTFQITSNTTTDNILNYSNFNFVGIEFVKDGKLIDGSSMENLHVDFFVPGNLAAGAAVKIKLRNVGVNGVVDNDSDGRPAIDDTEITKIVALPSSGNWVSVDFDISGFSTKEELGQIVFDSTGNSTPSSFFVDNVYFWKTQTAPIDAAPTPTLSASNVISVFSDAYTNITGSDFNPNWGQATVVSEEQIAGNTTLKYANLNYQGLQLGSAQDVTGMTHLHIDYFTANSSSLNGYLISSGPVEKAKGMTVPTASVWVSLEIPLGDFSPVDLADIIQLKFDGNGEVYLDNIYFHN